MMENSEYGRNPNFPPGWWIVPLFIVSVIFWTLIAFAAFAQTTSGAVSGSAANNQNTNAAGAIAAGNSIVVNGDPARTRSEVQYGGTYRVESAPAVSAPAIFGGGHPCLAGKSGGLSVVGGGFSYGQGNPEPACMAWIMGQPEVALSIMFADNASFRAATCKVGYWRVGTSRIPVQCKGQVVATASTRAPTVGSATFSKCSYDPASNKLTFKKKPGVDSAVALAACKQAAGL